MRFQTARSWRLSRLLAISSRLNRAGRRGPTNLAGIQGWLYVAEHYRAPGDRCRADTFTLPHGTTAAAKRELAKSFPLALAQFVIL